MTKNISNKSIRKGRKKCRIKIEKSEKEEFIEFLKKKNAPTSCSIAIDDKSNSNCKSCFECENLTFIIKTQSSHNFPLRREQQFKAENFIDFSCCTFCDYLHEKARCLNHIGSEIEHKNAFGKNV